MTPTVAEERAMALRRPGTWRRMSILTQIVLFILTAAAVAAFSWLCELLEFPRGVVTAIAAIGLAEFLILRKHFWRTGVESALWIGGLFAFIVALPSSGKPEAILAFVAASAIAGWRMRNALFGVLAAVLVVVYLQEKHWPWIAAAFALAVAIVALIAELRVWQRPSTEFLWQIALLVMPVAAYVPVTHRAIGDLRVVLIFALLAVLLILIGVRFRLPIVLAASAIALAIAAIEARPRIGFSAETYLIVAGAVVLAVAAALMQALRGGERGFVLTEEPHEIDELLQIAGTLPLATPAAASAQATPTGGGQFGGAGASGQF